MTLVEKYGKRALVAGASEGLGAAFAHYLAAARMDLVLIARNESKLRALANELSSEYQVQIQCISVDLSSPDAVAYIMEELKGEEVNLLIYNAALSFISPFEDQSPEDYQALAQVNMLSPLHLVQALSGPMLQKGKGAMVLMASLAGFQGSGFLTAYGASKAFNRVFAEGLWYEWKDRGVDVMACCAGATSTPNFIATQPEKTSFFAPKVQSPEEVVNECMRNLGKKASFISGRGNRIASFIMQKIMPRKMAISIMGDTTRKMYRF
jgi:short-subunit dehydrogenase